MFITSSPEIRNCPDTPLATQPSITRNIHWPSYFSLIVSTGAAQQAYEQAYEPCLKKHE